nr:pentatricopeptide repeat-containing protein [Tanacetum cinerariifolium]
MFIEFVIQTHFFSYSLEEFAQILDIPCEGACLFTDKWSFDELVNGVPTDGPYQTNPFSPDDIISSIRIDREGQVRRIRYEEEINVHEYQFLTREIMPILKPLEEIIREYVFCLGDRVMNPLTAKQERKTRKDRDTRRGRHFTSSSSAFNYPSSSHVNDDDDDGNDKGTSRASTHSPICFVNSLTNEVPQGCALLRNFFKEDLFTYCLENGILKDSFEPSNDNTNVFNALQEPFIVNQDPEDIFCHQCTCELCGNGAHYGYNCPPKVPIILNPEPFNNQTIKELPPTMPSFDPTCYSKDGNSFTYDPKSNLVHDSPNVFNPPSQPPLYSCEFCGNNARYGHYCTPQVSFIYPEPCYNQDFNFPQDFHDFQQQYLCCENCGVTHEAYQCQPMNEDYYHEQNSCYDPNSFGFDQFQPPQYTVNHPIFNTQNDLFNSQSKLMEQLTSMCDMVGQYIQKKEKEKQIEKVQAAKTRYWKIPACYDDDDDDDYTIAITHEEPGNSLSMGDEHLDTVPATESDEFIKSSIENLVPNPSESEGEHECDSFSNEDIPNKIYSNPLFDEEINSMKIDLHHFNVESDLVDSLLNRDSPIISSSSKIDSLFDEFAGINNQNSKSLIFESFSKYNREINSQFFGKNDPIITYRELTRLKSIPPGINESDCDPEEETRFIKRLLYDNSSPHPPKEFIYETFDAAFESFSLFPIPVEDSDSFMEENDLSFTPDDPMSSGIEEDDYDSERDILILKELLSNDSLLLPENKSFHFDIPSSSRPLAKTPDGNTEILNVKMMGDISEHKVPMPKLMSTLVPNQENLLISYFI